MSAGSLEEFQNRHACVIERLYAQGRAERWKLSAAEFATALYRSAAGRFAAEATFEVDEIERYLGSLNVEDLALAAACERGNQQAWIEFLGRFRPVLFGAAISLAREEAQAQEITDSLYADLYGLEERDGRRRSLFQYFHGRSSLGTWLRSVVARTFVDGYRAARRGQALRGRLNEAIGHHSSSARSSRRRRAKRCASFDDARVPNGQESRLSGPADSDKSFEHILASFLREDLGPSRKDCPHPGLLSAYFEGKLAEPEARELEIHLSSCSGCQAEIAALLHLQPEPAPQAAQPKPVDPAPPMTVVKAEPPPEPEKVMPPSQPAVGATPFKPRRRRALWTWVGPVALAASAVLAITVTYRFAPLIGEASRKSRESELRARALENAVPLAASRDTDTQTKEALEAPQAAPALTTVPRPAAPPMLDKMPAAESQSAPAESMARQETDRLSRAPTVTVQQAPAAPSLEPASPRAMAPREGANEPSEAKQAAKDERELEAPRTDQAAPAPAGQANAGAAAKAMKPTTDRGVVIIARTNLDVVWRLRDATIERSDDAGKTWRGQPTGDATGLLAGSAPSAKICWLAGRSGLVLRTTDGEHWKRLVPPTTSDLTQIRARDATKATARTASGERFSTNDGGQSWSKL